MQKLNKCCDLGVSKVTFEELGWVSLEDSKVWKIVHWWAPLSKKYNFSVKTFQRNYVSWHWKLMQILKENWHVAWKRSVKGLEMYTLIRSFCPKHIKFRWKNTEDLCFLALKSDAKLKEKLTLSFENDMRNLVNFYPTTQKPKNFTSMGNFCPKYMRFELKKYRGVIFMKLKWCKMAQFIEWTVIRAPKSEKLYNDGLFLSKAFYVSARKF